MRVFAIDPGLGGGWAVVIDGRPEVCGDMPVAGDGPRRRMLAGVLAEAMRRAAPDLCVIERANAMPKQGVSSTFRFGMSFGAAIAVPSILGVPFELVMPQVWKQHFKLRGLDKEASRQRALDLAPWLSSSLDRKRDEGRAEAVLIGIYAEITWGSQKVAA